MNLRKVLERVFNEEEHKIEFKQLGRMLKECDRNWCNSKDDSHEEKVAKINYRYIAAEMSQLVSKNSNFRVVIPDILRGRDYSYMTFYPEKGRSFDLKFGGL